jgi:NAD(P)-dependent dehydrogenase (short-subunit alcohol dehydrogenase family)
MTEQVLAGKVAIVTGAGGGIGASYARVLAEAGAAVAVADINTAGATAVADQLVADGFTAIAVEVNIGDEQSTLTMAEEVENRLGRIDILVNNAALMAEIEPLPITELPLERWTRIIDINLTGALRCTRAVLPALRRQGGGKIINQSSGGAFQPSGVYGVTKIGIVSMTAHLSHELAKDNIRVNAIAPGFVTSDAGKRAAGPGWEDHDNGTVPFPFGDVTDLSGALIFLASSASDWVTGQTLNVDGGWIHRI